MKFRLTLYNRTGKYIGTIATSWDDCLKDYPAMVTAKLLIGEGQWDVDQK